MEIIVFEKESYYKMVEEMKKLLIESIKSARKNEKEWLSTEEAKELLGIKSKSKLQQLRDTGEIIFSQHGRIIKYQRSSILKFLERNAVK